MKQTKKIEQKRNEKKDKPKKIKDVTVNNDNEVARLFQFVAIVAAFVLVFYGLTALLTNKDSSETKETEIQYKEILVGELWNQGGSYLVLALKTEDREFQTLYESYVQLYNSRYGTKYYTIDLNNGFNHQYVADESNLYTTNHADIRFKDDTLLKVVDGVVTEAKEGKDAIINYLNSAM